MTDGKPTTYQVKQYYFDERGERNEDVNSFSDLTTHHPKANFNARMRDGALEGVERPHARSHAFIGGDYQEIEAKRTDEYHTLEDDQTLLIKDFILEDQGKRSIDVPSPVAGYVSRVDGPNGLVEIKSSADGDIIARIRHLKPISVEEGQDVAYGESLGTQNNQGLGLDPGKSIHVHMEMDTRHYQQFENYVSDLVSGRLPIEAEHRENVEPQPVIDDGTFRLGESGERIRDLQRVMAEEGYRAADGQPLDQDGVYRLGMQGAVLDFQRDHGVPQTGDVDPAALRFAPPTRSREVDRQDHFMHGQPMQPAVPEPPTAPGHPDHPDHRPGLPDPLEPPVNQRGPRTGSLGDPQLDRLAEALLTDDDAALSRIAAEIERSPEVQAMIRQGHQVLAEQERQQEQERQAQQQSPAQSLG